MAADAGGPSCSFSVALGPARLHSALAGTTMRRTMTFTAGLVVVWLWAGCTTHKPSSIVFLGLPESETSGRGPVGLINGQACRINDVTAVSVATWEQYQEAKRAGRIFAEEAHGDSVYYAVKEHRDARFDNASAQVEVVERFKARKPQRLPTRGLSQ